MNASLNQVREYGPSKVGHLQWTKILSLDANGLAYFLLRSDRAKLSTATSTSSPASPSSSLLPSPTWPVNPSLTKPPSQSHRQQFQPLLDPSFPQHLGTMDLPLLTLSPRSGIFKNLYLKSWPYPIRISLSKILHLVGVSQSEWSKKSEGSIDLH